MPRYRELTFKIFAVDCAKDFESGRACRLWGHSTS